MDLINSHLATAALNPKYERSIQAALAIGKKLLNKYYDMSDHSELYRIAMGMSIHHWNPFLPLINLSSSSPKPQAGILQDGQMGGRLGEGSGGHCTRRV